MSLAEGILWFLSTFLGCWGATLIVRGLRGEGVRRHWKPPQSPANQSETATKRRSWIRRFRPTWRLVGLGLLGIGAGSGAWWFATAVHEELDLYGNPSPFTPFHAAAAGVALFGVMLLTHAIIGDRSKGRKRCPRCWYDMSGATFDTGEEGEPTSATCPECGQSVAKLADLRRSRRPKSLIAAGLALLVLGAGGLLAASLVGRPMGLVPRFALTTWLFLPGDAPEWVTEEIWQRSLNQSDGQIGFTLTRRWIDGVIADKTVGHDPQLLEVITALVDYNSGWPSQDSVPLSDLEQAWAIANPELAERLVLGDAGTHAEAAQMLARMDWLLTVLLQEHPDLPQRNARDMRRPADVFPPPEYAVQIDSELESAFTSAPHLISSLNPLLGPHAYDRYREPLLAAFDTLPEDSRDFTVLCYLFGQAIYISDEARADALGLIESDTEQDVIHGLRAVTGSIYLGRPTLGPELLNAIRARATDPSDRIRQQAWHTLQRVDRIDPKTMRQVAEIAMASASDAERVLNGFYTDYFRSRSDVTMAYLRQLAASPDPAVRLVVAQNVKHIPLNVDASREILTLLSGDDDPEVARAAELRLDP